MALAVRLQITNGAGGMNDIETLEVKRLTKLHHAGGDPRDAEIHKYVATRWSPFMEKRAEATFRHRYGDGAWVCVRKALEALSDSEGQDSRDDPEMKGKS